LVIIHVQIMPMVVSKGSFWDSQSNGADAKRLDKVSAGCFHK
jgi:hypothetical protein